MSYFGTYSLEGGGLLCMSVIWFLSAFRRWKLVTPNSVNRGKKEVLLLFNLSEQALISTEL